MVVPAVLDVIRLVAVSRAKDQALLFHSVTPGDLSPKCIRHQLLEYFRHPKVEPTPVVDTDIADLKMKAETVDRDRIGPPEPFDSWFEVDVFLTEILMGHLKGYGKN